MPHCRLTIAAFTVVAASTIHAQSPPLADHHQHLFSPFVSVAESVKPINADDLIVLLDVAGIRRVQIADLAGAGGYEDPLVDEALSVFAEAIEKGDPRTKNLYLDVTPGSIPKASIDRNGIPEHLRERAAVYARAVTGFCRYYGRAP